MFLVSIRTTNEKGKKEEKATITDNSNQLISATVVRAEVSPEQNNETSKTSPENCMNAGWSLKSNDNDFCRPMEKTEDLSRKKRAFRKTNEYNHRTTVNDKNILK